MRFLGMGLALWMLKMKLAAASVPLESVPGLYISTAFFASYRDELAWEVIRAYTCSLLMYFRRAGTRARPWFAQKTPRKAADPSKSVCCLHWPEGAYFASFRS